MKAEMIAELHEAFEKCVHPAPVVGEGDEFWLARDLQVLLDYADWRNFEDAIARAKTACTTMGQEVSHHFGDTTRMVEIGSGASRQIPDIACTRLAAYLIAMNGDRPGSGSARR